MKQFIHENFNNIGYNYEEKYTKSKSEELTNKMENGNQS